MQGNALAASSICLLHQMCHPNNRIWVHIPALLRIPISTSLSDIHSTGPSSNNLLQQKSTGFIIVIYILNYYIIIFIILNDNRKQYFVADSLQIAIESSFFVIRHLCKISSVRKIIFEWFRIWQMYDFVFVFHVGTMKHGCIINNWIQRAASYRELRLVMACRLMGIGIGMGLVAVALKITCPLLWSMN